MAFGAFVAVGAETEFDVVAGEFADNVIEVLVELYGLVEPGAVALGSVGVHVGDYFEAEGLEEFGEMVAQVEVEDLGCHGAEGFIGVASGDDGDALLPHAEFESVEGAVLTGGADGGAM